MLNPMKMKLLDELLEYLSDSQGNDLKSLAAPKAPDPLESPDPLEKLGEHPPKGVAIEKISVMGKPKDGMPGEEGEADEPNDDELQEILKKIGR